MTQHDARGLPLSTDSDLAAAYYRQSVDHMLSLWPDAGALLDQTIQADPAFALAFAARARFCAIRAELPQARALIASAEALAAERGSERERSHVAVIGHAIGGRAALALPAALDHVSRWPRDVMVLSMLMGPFGLLAFSGMADHDQARVDLCARLRADYDADDWWFLTYHGWSLAEAGDVVGGRPLTERGFELRRHNANAAHALAHVMHEAGDFAQAQALVEEWLPCYGREGPLFSHIAWHSALVSLETGDVDRALASYTDRIAPDRTVAAPINVISDTASFLWRLQVYGHAVPQGLWQQADQYAGTHFREAGFAFADVHMAIIDAAVGNCQALDRRALALTSQVEASRLPAGPVVPALCHSFAAFADGDHKTCARLLEPVMTEVVRIGGSGAQREVVEDMLLVALMRSGELIKARNLLHRRLHRRPSQRDARWLAGLV